MKALLVFIFLSNICLAQKPYADYSLEEAIELYENGIYEPQFKYPKWRGFNYQKCKPGKLAKSYRERALRQINYFRFINDYIQIIPENKSNTPYAQAAAFVCDVNENISHNPTSKWYCITKASLKGCSYSLLSIRGTKILNFIEDKGIRNYGVGHRRALLNTTLKAVGYGATFRTEAIYQNIHSNTKHDSLNNEYANKMILYPAAGFNEIDLVFPRWSFGLPQFLNVNFENTYVKLITNAGDSYETVLLEYKEIYDPTIVWEIKETWKLREKLLNSGGVKVRVENVIVNGERKDYEYTVKFFDYPEKEFKEPLRFWLHRKLQNYRYQKGYWAK